MLSRGIDPLVTDPSCCHAHPPAPPQWPSRAQLAAYAADVRRQVLAAVRRGVSPGTGNSAAAGGASGSCPAPAGGGSAAGQVSAAGQFSMQALMMVLEHERQHQEVGGWVGASWLPSLIVSWQVERMAAGSQTGSAASRRSASQLGWLPRCGDTVGAADLDLNSLLLQLAWSTPWMA